MSHFTTISAVAAPLLLAAAASAAVVPIASYDMVNGRSGFNRYIDETYNGAGNPFVDSSLLSGGTGQLTDGILGTDNILDNNSFDWLGWLEVQPSIRFDLGQIVQLDQLSVRAASSSPFGDVDLPGTITIDFSNDGVIYFGSVVRTTTAGERANPLSQWINVDLAGVSARYARAAFTDGDQPWIFLSETQFTGTIPAPAATGLLAFAGLAASRRRR